ncbi:hypothetical protein MNBD_GAMMA12-3825 [hydrothermal vent metagenome]|uniref:Uncharacterized protein n=1 Tax=hydrothermal vent metagenome TaxID=652676 RepID=A0A3B0Y7K8_9ZZZZ
MIIIQHTTVRWGKKSRGAPHAKVRSKVPSQYLLPVSDIERGVLIHEIRAEEHNHFTPQENHWHNFGQKQYRNFTISEVEGCLEVFYKYTSLGVMPRRGKYKQKVMCVKAGESGVFIINYRNTFGGISYSQETANIFFGEKYVPDHFLKCTPVKVVDKTVKLY